MAMTLLRSDETSSEVNWFHGKLSREMAETTLKFDGTEGCYLVRESTTSRGDYVLCVLWADTVHHIQIRRHENDAFFSIDEGHLNVIHGLDELIRSYSKEDEILLGEHKIILRKPLICSPPPPDCKRHGSSNLLHRAASNGSLVVIKGLITDPKRNLEAKNDKGQTAVHIACIKGYDAVLKCLISVKCNVNAKDSFSCTPLHYACMHNHPNIVDILMDMGCAIPWYRRDDDEYTDWVPLHEAAARGHKECIEILLDVNHAAQMPRTYLNKLPADLAFENNYISVSDFIKNYKPPRPKLVKCNFYHDNTTRQEAFDLLYENSKDPNAGYFLIRYSEKQKADVLTLFYGSATPNYTNYQILITGEYCHIDNGPYFASMEDLVQYYSKWSDGLPTILKHPVPPPAQLVPPPLPRRTPRSSPNPFNNNINNSRSFFPKENIPSDWIEVGRSLGEGEYGLVNEAILRVPGRPDEKVAVKTLNQELNEHARSEFIQEANLMLNLDHEHIVKLIGFCWDKATYMVQELMLLGSLRDYLIENRSKISVETDISLWAYQIAKGMRYLEEMRLVHRDLAARNILLARHDYAKISDFGLSRALNPEQNYYTASKGGRWPVKWYAPESCMRAIFNSQSDVWSYGVTLWELFSFGDTPFPNLEGKDVVSLIEKGERLMRPDSCPENIFVILLKCWENEPSVRIRFSDLVKFFDPANDSLSAHFENNFLVRFD